MNAPQPLVFDADRPIIDSHHHLFVRPALRYLVDEYHTDVTAGHRIIASVYMEAGAFLRPDGPEGLRPLGEIEFANGVGAMAQAGYFGDTRVCAGIVGTADLRQSPVVVADLLDRCLAAAPERFRGIRQIALDHPSPSAFRYMSKRPPQGILRDPNFLVGLSQLARRGLSFDLAIYHEQFLDAARLLDLFPDMTFILNHMGIVMGLDSSQDDRRILRQQWAAGLRDLATRQNVFCKIGGLGMPVWGFDQAPRTDEDVENWLVEQWQPYVHAALEAFGADRCMFESNFPIDRAACSYRTLWNVFKRLVSSAQEHERDAVCHGTAARVYKLIEDAIPANASIDR